MAGSSDDAASGAPDEGAPYSTTHTSGVRPLASAGESRSRLILFASRDEGVFSQFEGLMPPGVRVLRLDDVFSLLESLRGQDDEPTLVVDQRDGMFRAETIAALSCALPAGAQVLLWGGRAEELEKAAALAEGRSFHRAEASASVEELAWMCRPGTRSDLPPAPAVPHLLILDDDDAYSRSVARLLRTAGFEVEVERDARLAVDLCRRGGLVAALVDLHMPGMNGSTFASTVRLSMGDDAPKIILVTGGDAGALDDGLFDAILHKPVGPAKLLATLADLIPADES